MDEPQLDTAPRWRSALAVLADGAVASAAAWGLRLRGGTATAGIRLLGPSSELVRQQLGSPGQRLLGVRTVDRRTGARIAPWRSLAALGIGLGAQLITARMRPPAPTPEQQRERERHLQAMSETYRRHSADPAAGEEERARLMEHAPAGASADLWRNLGPTVAVTLLAGRLRRRLIATEEIRRA